MKLFIDTSDNTQTIVGLNGDKMTVPTKEHKSQQLLSLINQSLKKKHSSINKIKEIEVNLGPGSFTGLKVGVSVANALGWVLKVPINKKKVGQLVEPEY